MISFSLKHHKDGMYYQQPHFFILNKGNNSGKVLNVPCPNCYVILFYSIEDRDNMETICLTLWRAKFWHQFLMGSVIPYIRIKEFQKNLIQKSSELMEDFEKHKKSIAALKLLETKEKQFQENLNLINDLRRVIIYRYVKK